MVRVSNQSIYEPVRRSLLGADLFMNEEYIMLLNYEALKIEYINLRYGFSLTRKIWTQIPIIGLKTASGVFIVHDFVLVRQKSNPAILLNLKISNLNPHITRGSDTLVVNELTPIKYMRTDCFSVVSLGYSYSLNINAILSTSILKYQLSPSRSSEVGTSVLENNILFSFFVVFFTWNKLNYLNQVNIKITQNYIIDTNIKDLPIQIYYEEATFKINELFKGNIYSVDFKVSSIDSEDTEQVLAIFIFLIPYIF